MNQSSLKLTSIQDDDVEVESGGAASNPAEPTSSPSSSGDAPIDPTDGAVGASSSSMTGGSDVMQELKESKDNYDALAQEVEELRQTERRAFARKTELEANFRKLVEDQKANVDKMERDFKEMKVGNQNKLKELRKKKILLQEAVEKELNARLQRQQIKLELEKQLREVQDVVKQQKRRIDQNKKLCEDTQKKIDLVKSDKKKKQATRREQEEILRTLNEKIIRDQSQIRKYEEGFEFVAKQAIEGNLQLKIALDNDYEESNIEEQAMDEGHEEGN